MNILHYSLGLPPHRSGGLTKYSTDLLITQTKSNDLVSLLYPGDFTFWKKPKIRIIRNESFKGVNIYEIQNPTIVPIRHGVSNPNSILSPAINLTEGSLEQFYQETKPEIFHIHTLMGLPFELLEYFRRKGVKTIFTTHDYYGLCLKVNFINQLGLCCTMPGKEQCAVCNNNAPSSLFLKLRNSKYILKYKTKLSVRARELEIKQSKTVTKIKISPSKENEFDLLINYYLDQFSLMDCFHFNSSVTKNVYEQYIRPKTSIVLPISHADVLDKRKLKNIDKKNVKIGFIGSQAVYKGFPLLKSVLLEVFNEGFENWSLQVWGGTEVKTDDACNKIEYKGAYLPAELESVFGQMNLLIVPSIWKETFSLIALEAISFGVPVLVSENVGAKDIVKNYNTEFIFEPTNQALKSKIKLILKKPTSLIQFNKSICLNKFDYSIEAHVENINQLYINILKQA